MLILDTHVFIWWRSKTDGALSPAATEAIASASELGVPAVCCLEVAQHAVRDRIRLDRDVRVWLEQALRDARLLPLTPEIAVEAARLRWTHRDPFDRVIVATAIMLHAPIVTRDRLIRSFPGVRTIW